MENKITIKHYLNTEVKPAKRYDIEEYPSYCQIIFRRNNTKFAFNWPNYIDGYNALRDYKRYDKNSFQKFLTQNKEIISEANREMANAINFEEKKYKNKFTLKGFKDRFYVYNLSFIRQFGEDINYTIFEKLRISIGKQKASFVYDNFSSLGLEEFIKYIDKEFAPGFIKEVNKNLNDRIVCYYLLLCFIKEDIPKNRYSFWFHEEGIARFNKFLSDKSNIKKNNPIYTLLQQRPFKANNTYISLAEKFIKEVYQANIDQYFK